MAHRYRPNGSHLALLIAPLSACVSVFVWQLMWNVARGAALGVPSDHPVLALLVWLWILILFGMPVGLIATVTILLPLTWLAGNRMPWWVPTLVGAAAGQVLLIVYAHLLSPHGTFAFAPGDGALAGATNGLVFWWIALRRPRDWQPPQSAGE